ncbi:MAG: hypothetical protein WCW40_11735, partial [Bacteroidota bacterium]
MRIQLPFLASHRSSLLLLSMLAMFVLRTATLTAQPPSQDGSLDGIFGTTGTRTTAIGSAGEQANSVALQSDGKIVVAGHSENGSNWD